MPSFSTGNMAAFGVAPVIMVRIMASAGKCFFFIVIRFVDTICNHPDGIAFYI
jgi:hypothetical protein